MEEPRLVVDIESQDDDLMKRVRESLRNNPHLGGSGIIRTTTPKMPYPRPRVSKKKR